MSFEEEKLSQQVREIIQIGKEEKGVDTAGLLLNALARNEENQVSAKSRRWAYFISLGFPPFGLLFALKYYFGSESSAKHVALMCVILTVISILITWWTLDLLVSSSGITPEQVQQMNVDEYYELIK